MAAGDGVVGSLSPCVRRADSPAAIRVIQCLRLPNLGIIFLRKPFFRSLRNDLNNYLSARLF